MKFQLQAGFILKSLNDILDKKVNQFKGYQDILRNLSYFSVELEKSSPRKEEGIDSVFNVVANLLSRGLPTIPSIYVEDFISTKLEFASKEQNDIGSINFRPNKEISESELRSLFNCFYIIDPRLQDPMGLNQNFDSWEDHSGSEYEEILYKKSKIAFNEFKKINNNKYNTFVVAGGVAANKKIRKILIKLCDEENFKAIFPPINLCGDNAAMIAMVGLEKFKIKKFDTLDFPAKPRWALDEKAAFLKGAGVKL